MSDAHMFTNIDPNIEERLQAGVKRLADNDHVFSDRYRNNIKVLERCFPEIYKEIKDYKPNNGNIFLEKDGALNLFFPDTGYTLFSDTPFSQIEHKYNSFIRSPTRTIINVETSISNRTRHAYYISRINVKKNEFKKELSPHNGIPHMMGGIVLFGFDLGYQLIKILDNHYVKHIYIYEENLDLFYYSLFSIDWEWVVDEMERRNCTLHFFLGVDEKTFVSRYMGTIRFNGIYMAAHTYLYMGYSREHVKAVWDEFIDHYVRQIIGWGFFDDGARGLGQYLARKNDTYLAVIPDYESKPGFNRNLDIPVFVLGNGPSLDANIEFVKANLNNAIIMSCGTTINTLSKYGIKPDYQLDVERLRHTAEKLDFLDKDFLSDVTALTVNVMHPEFYDHFERTLIGLKPSEPVTSIMKNSELVSKANRSRLLTLNYSGPIVANLGVSYAGIMGFSDVYLIGVDCGFRDPKNHHSKASGYYNKDGSNTGLTEFKKGLLERKANFGGKAYTTAIMDTSRVQLELSIDYSKSRNKVFHCYNLSDGVKIKGADALVSEDALISELPPQRKSQIKEYVWEHIAAYEDDSFESRDIGDIVTAFSEICSSAKEILQQDFSSKEELLTVLSQFNSLLMKQYFTTRPYNCELIYGSFIYFANEIVDLTLCSPDDSLDMARELIEFFIEFLDEMPVILASPMDLIDKGRGLLADGKYNA